MSKGQFLAEKRIIKIFQFHFHQDNLQYKLQSVDEAPLKVQNSKIITTSIPFLNLTMSEEFDAFSTLKINENIANCISFPYQEKISQQKIFFAI